MKIKCFDCDTPLKLISTYVDINHHPHLVCQCPLCGDITIVRKYW